MVNFLKATALPLLILLIFSPHTWANSVGTSGIPRDYSAVYRVFYNGNDVADVTVRLSHEDDLWTFHGYTHDMRGLAGVLNVEGSQVSRGKWREGRFKPEEYEFSFSLIGYRKKWRADFDWPSGTVTTSGKDGDVPLPLTPGAADPLSLSLNLRAVLAEHQSRFDLDLVDEGTIENQAYQADATELIDTALGCVDTTRVTRLRENSKRTSQIWYAHQHDFIPVKIQHNKKGGSRFMLKIRSLEFGGQKFQPVQPCSSSQARVAINDPASQVVNDR